VLLGIAVSFKLPCMLRTLLLAYPGDKKVLAKFSHGKWEALPGTPILPTTPEAWNLFLSLDR
jgi:hypothetical protein